MALTLYREKQGKLAKLASLSARIECDQAKKERAARRELEKQQRDAATPEKSRDTLHKRAHAASRRVASNPTGCCRVVIAASQTDAAASPPP